MSSTIEGLNRKELDAVREFIESRENFLITTHVNADPDALGSELALAEALRQIGKRPQILNPTPVSKNNRFLDVENEIKVFPENGTSLQDSVFDGVFILDISRWERLGQLADPIRYCGKPKVTIDHHPYTGGFADHHLINVGACASAEIIYDLLEYMKIPVNDRIAECIYASMVADTGSFTFSNTTARCHRIVSELLNYQVCARSIFENLYQNHTPERLKFLGYALSQLKFDCEGHLAWFTISHQTLLEHGMSVDDLEGFVDIPRNCRSVLLSILFLEVEPNDIKISLRSKGSFNSNQLASMFGGGGHGHASGIRMLGPLSEVEGIVLQQARIAIQPFLQEKIRLHA